MNELTKIVKSYLLSVIITILTTIVFCGIFIVQTNTDRMLFGWKNVALNRFAVYNNLVFYMKGCTRISADFRTYEFYWNWK